MNITVFEIEPVVVWFARRWFDVVDDDNRRTIVDEGVEAIQRFSKKGSILLFTEAQLPFVSFR